MAFPALSSTICVLFFLMLKVINGQVLKQPEQIHISFGGDETEMIITWVTLNETNTSTVEFGIEEMDTLAVGSSVLFVDGGNESRSMFIHRVLMKNLLPGQQYIYHCGNSDDGWSPVFWFRAMERGNQWSPRLAVYGDLGNVNAQSLTRLQEGAQMGHFDAILHVGDFAYDLDSDNARVGDAFMTQLEPIAAYVPYMTCAGNHESKYNFSNYGNRFSMVDQTSRTLSNFFYSFNIGPAHIISFTTEFYFFLNYGSSQIENQYIWLENDLRTAYQPENRMKRPWIITIGHRPMYCSNKMASDCDNGYSLVRNGISIDNSTPAFGLEVLFYNYGVDLALWGHEHSYERLFPVYNLKVYNGSAKNPYTNPKATVHITTGSAGCWEKHSSFEEIQPPWSAFRNTDYGYTILTITNKTHLHLQQLSDDQGGAIVDDIWIEKSLNMHGVPNV